MTRGLPLTAGQRTSLRRFVEQDITPEYIGWLKDQEVVKYSRQRLVRHSPETCREFLSTFTDSSDLFLVIGDLATKRDVGTMTARLSPGGAEADLAILIGDRSVWGTGVGRDAWSTLMRYVISHCGVRRVTGGTVVENRAMQRIMEGCGMVLVEERQITECLGCPPRRAYSYAWTATGAATSPSDGSFGG